MSKHCKSLVALLAPLLLAFAALPAQAAANRIEAFDAQSWQRFQSELPRPSAIVFSTTDCSHCPVTIASIAQRLKQRNTHIPLIVVVMDGDEQPGLLQDPHYRQASRLFVFKGQTATLQYAVNPKWRGITPYVALLPQAGDVRLMLGNPSAQDIDSWLTAGKK